MGKEIRRVVTGHDGEGKAVVIIDGDAPNVRERELMGVTSTQIWRTFETPADMTGGEDVAVGEVPLQPPPGGSVCRVVEFAPNAGDLSHIDGEKARQEIGAHPVETPEGKAVHPFMHRTASIDYAVVISGEIDMLMDDSEVHFKAGDVLVQRGTNHAWVNRGSEPCRIAFILIDGDPV